MSANRPTRGDVVSWVAGILKGDPFRSDEAILIARAYLAALDVVEAARQVKANMEENSACFVIAGSVVRMPPDRVSVDILVRALDAFDGKECG